MVLQRRGNAYIGLLKILGFIGTFVGCVFFISFTQAATVTWTGSGTGTWESAGSWSGGSVPTSADDVVVSSATGTLIVVTLSSGQTADFNTLTIGGGTGSSTLVLVGNIGTGGNITVDSNGQFKQQNTTAQTISGNLVIKSGGYFTHNSNSTAQSYIIDFSATTLDVQAGGQINVTARGYAGGSPGGGSGQGPGGGFGTTVAASAAGGNHGGTGGNNAGTYCVISNVNTIGSGGGSGNNSNNVTAAGGGLIRLNTTGTTTINGLIIANGGDGQSNAFSGAGAGGGIKIVARKIIGTPSPLGISAAGGNAIPSFSFDGGSGGGGCIQILYSLSSSISSVNVAAGTEPIAGTDGLSSISQNNTSPSATSISPSQTSSTTVQFSTTISDSDLQVSTLKVHYSTDGSTWVSSTLGTVSASSGTVTTTETGRIGSIDTDTGSITLTIPWAASTDLPETDDTTVYLRVIPNDGVTDGAAVTSSAFALDTKKPTQMGNISVSSTTSTAVTLGLPTTTSTDTNFLEYKIYYGTTSPVTTASSAFTSSTDSDLGNNNFNATVTTSISSLTPNTTYYFKLFAFDTWGNRTSSITEVSTTTKASIPSSVVATSNSQTQITLSWSGDGTDYYAENTTASTNSGWTSATSYAFTGLTCNTSYTFQVKSRNSALIEGSFSSTVSASTDACTSNNNGGGGGGGFGSPPPITPSPAPTNPTTNPNGNLTFPDDFYFFPWMRPGGDASAPPHQEPGTPTDLGIPENPDSAINLTKLPTQALVQGSTLTFTYSFKNTTSKRQSFKIIRQIIREENQKTIATSPGTRTLNSKQPFSYAPKDKLTNLYTPGIYQVKITVYDSSGKKQLDQNSFKFEVTQSQPTPSKPLSSSTLTFSRIPQKPLLPNQYVTYSYSFKNLTGKTQTFRILREFVNQDTNRVLVISKGYRQLKPNQSFTYTPADKITKNFVPGMYAVRITVYDNGWGKVEGQSQLTLEIQGG